MRKGLNDGAAGDHAVGQLIAVVRLPGKFRREQDPGAHDATNQSGGKFTALEMVGHGGG